VKEIKVTIGGCGGWAGISGHACMSWRPLLRNAASGLARPLAGRWSNAAGTERELRS